MATILCVGHAAFDLLLPLADFPLENRKYHLESASDSSGGPAANAASLLGRWGVRPALLAPIGDDAFGDRVRADLAEDGVETGLLRRDAGIPTPLSVILANAATGSRTILTNKPRRPSLEFDEEALARFAPESEIAGLVLDGHEAEASTSLMNRYPRAWSLLDAGTLREGTERLARSVDYLVASEAFVSALAKREGIASIDGMAEERAGEGQARDAEAELGVAALRVLSDRWICFTRGERGCVWQAAPNGPVRTLAALPGEAVDTTGAGDIFHGAFAYGILTEGSPERALLWATAAAGLSVRKSGGRPSIPTLDEAREALRRME